MRLFIGLPVPETLQKQLAHAWQKIETYPSKDRPVKPSLWHLTLAFLDDVPEDHLEKLDELTGMAVKHPPAGIFTIDAFETFPPRNPTRIVARTVPQNQMQWGMFVDGICDLMSLAAPRVDRKPWKPHISIIRKEKGLKLAHWSAHIDPIAWKPMEIAIIESAVGPHGSTYKNRHVFPLDV